MVQNKILKLLLIPISLLWSFIYRVRRFCYNYGILKKEYFKVPIVSVGNVTFGGTGKTPMIIWLSKKVEEFNRKPLILTRGYKSDLENSSALVFSKDQFKKSSKAIGDEPLMIVNSLKDAAIVVGKDRSANLKKFYPKVNSDIVFLDDGFQHLKIHRSLNLVLFDASVEISQYKTAPLGYLREGLSSLKFADTIIFTRADQVSNEQFDKLNTFLKPYLKENVSIARCFYSPTGVFNLSGNKELDVQDLKSKKVISLTALASPKSFDKSLKEFGVELIAQKVFKDHHFFSEEEITSILDEAKKLDAIVVMTKKDAVKLKGITQDRRLLYLDISVEFLSGQLEVEQRLRNMLQLDSI